MRIGRAVYGGLVHVSLASLLSLACALEAPERSFGAMDTGVETTQGAAAEVVGDVRCVDYETQRQVFWGELHVHSGASMDAYMWDVRGTADDVYRFAKGETIQVAPLDAGGRGTRPIRLERPLDFAALTDHASYLGEVALCTRPESRLYASEACRVFREGVENPSGPLGDLGARMSAISKPLRIDEEIPARLESLCGSDLALCLDGMRTVWEEQTAAAERHDDRSSECRFTAFHG